MMLARDVERFHAVLGLQDVVAMGVQQIVEELHVELIVLHDQNRLGFRVHDFSSPAPGTIAKPLGWQTVPGCAVLRRRS